MPFPVIALIVAIASIALNVVSALLRPKLDQKPEGDYDIPTATEGRSIPIVWGTDLQESPNVVWWGDRREVRRNNIWRYFIGIAWALAHGAPRLKAIVLDERVIWTGNAGEGATIFLDQANLFGPNAGGIVWDLVYRQGGGSTTPDPYLAARVPGYPHHGRFAYLVSRGPSTWTSGSNWKGFIGNSPQLRNVAFELERCPASLSSSPVTPGGPIYTLTEDTVAGPPSMSGHPTADFWEAIGDLVAGIGWDDTDKFLKIVTPGNDPGGLSRFRAFGSNPHLGAHSSLRVIQFEIWTAQLPLTGCCPFHFLLGSPDGGSIYYTLLNTDLVAMGWATITMALDTSTLWRQFGPFGPPATQAQIDSVIANIGEISLWVDGNRQNNEVRLRNFSYDPDDTPPPAGGGCIGADANPIWVLYETMTNPVWGAGIDPTDEYEGIDEASFIAAADRVRDEGLGMSHIQQESLEMSRFAEQIMRHVDGTLYREPETGKWTVKLIRDDYDVSTIPRLDKTNIITVDEFGADSVGVLRDVVRVKFKDRTKQYRESVATFRDPAVRAIQGYSSSVELDFPFVRDPGVAQMIAEREALQYSYPLRRLRVTATRQASLLRPGDPFVFDWDAYGVESVFRVTSVRLGSPNDGRVSIEAVEDKFRISTSTIGSGPGGGSGPGSGGDEDDDPSGLVNVDAVRIDQLPWFYGRSSQPAISVMVARANDSQTGYALDAAVDPDPLVETQTNRVFAKRTITVTPLGGYEPDEHSFLVVESTPEWAALGVASDSQQRNGKHLAYLGTGQQAELFSFTSVTPVTGGLRLNNVRHGLLDTTPKSWPAGTVVWLVEQANNTSFSTLFTADIGTNNVRARSESGSLSQSPPEGITASINILSPHRRQRALTIRDWKVNGVYRGDVCAGTIEFDWKQRSRTDEDEILPQSDSRPSVLDPATQCHVLFYDETDTLVKTLTGITDVELWVTEAQLVEWFGYLPDWFRVEIRGYIGFNTFESWQSQSLVIEYVI